MSHKLGFNEQSLGMALERAYQEGRAGQWIEEALTNAIEAEATHIHYGAYVSDFPDSPSVIRRYIADNGYGIEREDMPKFLLSFGGSGKTLDLAENFGVGFKSAVLPWNGHGVLVMSRTKDDPDGWMCLIKKDESGRFGTVDFKYIDDDGDEAYTEFLEIGPLNSHVNVDGEKLWEAAARIFRAKKKEFSVGTVFVLMGVDHDHSTALLSDPEREVSDRAKEEFPHSRGDLVSAQIAQGFLTLPEDVTVTYAQVGLPDDPDVSHYQDTFATKNGVVGVNWSLSARGGSLAALRSSKTGIESEGRIENIDGRNTSIDWYMRPMTGTPSEQSKPLNNGNTGPLPMIAVSYQHGNGKRSYLRAYRQAGINNTRLYRQFGVRDGVRNRVMIVVNPVKRSENKRYGTVPSGGRGILTLAGNTPLPMDDWAEMFRRQLPEEIAAANALADSGFLEQDEDEKKRLRDLIKSLKIDNPFKSPRGRRGNRPETVTADADGSERGTQSGVTGKIAKGTGASTDKETSEHDRAEDDESTRRVRRVTGTDGSIAVGPADSEGEFVGKPSHREDPKEPTIHRLTETDWTTKGEDEQHLGVVVSGNDIYFRVNYPPLRDITASIHDKRGGSAGDYEPVHTKAVEAVVETLVKYVMSLRNSEMAHVGRTTLRKEGYTEKMLDDNAELSRVLTSLVLAYPLWESRAKTILGATFGAAHKAA